MLKKFVFGAAAIVMALTSCSDKDKEPNTRTLAGSLPAVVIPVNSEADPIITEMPIRLTQYFDRGGVWVCKVNKFDALGNSSLSFETPELENTEANWNYFINCLSNFTAEDGSLIREFKVALYNNYYFLSMNPNGNNNVQAPYGTIVACNYKVGSDYSVATFPSQAFYGGVTVTQYEQGSEQKEFSNNVPLYYIGIDLNKLTADVTIYNVKFAEAMPISLSAVTIRGLKLQPSREYGYIITGDDLIPGVGIGANEVDYPQYVFNHFEMHPTNAALTRCAITYTVAGKYQGSFTGGYPVE